MPIVDIRGILGFLGVALLDVASYLVLLPELGPGETAVTPDATASLLRADAAVDGELVATAQLTNSVLQPR